MLAFNQPTEAAGRTSEARWKNGGMTARISDRIAAIAEYATLVNDLIMRTFKVCDEALQQAGIVNRDLSGVILVGGPTRLGLIRNAVRDYFQQEPRTDVNPDEVVAMGAALHAASLLAPEQQVASRLQARAEALDGLRASRGGQLREETVADDRVVLAGARRFVGEGARLVQEALELGLQRVLAHAHGHHVPLTRAAHEAGLRIGPGQRRARLPRRVRGEPADDQVERAVVHGCEALQIFGGNGLTKEYPIEKILRDARASLIEDGCNEVLGLVGASKL